MSLITSGSGYNMCKYGNEVPQYNVIGEEYRHEELKDEKINEADGTVDKNEGAVYEPKYRDVEEEYDVYKPQGLESKDSEAHELQEPTYKLNHKSKHIEMDSRVHTPHTVFVDKHNSDDHA